MTLYYRDSKEMRLLLASLISLVALKIRKKVLTTLRNSDKISNTFRGALNKGINRLDDFINKLTDIVDGYRSDDPALYAFVLKDLINKNYNNYLFGEDKMVVNNILNRSNNMSTSTVSTVNTSVNSTISNDLNSTDPITQVAVSLTFDGNQTDNSDYFKYGYAFPNGGTYYGSKTTFTLDSDNNLTIISDGDPYPALAGKQYFTNDGTTPRLFGNLTLNEQNYNYTFVYRGGTNTTGGNYQFYSVTSTKGMGTQGLFTNGVSLDNPSAGLSVTGASDISANVPGGQKYAFNAAFFSSLYGIDNAGGHPSSTGYPDSSGNQAQYHLHDDLFFSTNGFNNSTFYNSNSYYSGTNYNGDYIRHSDGHSKIVAVLFDGYPVYGPYGYINPTDASSGVMLMTSSYTTWDQPFDGRPYTYTDVVYADNGTPITMSAGAYLNDYYYVEGLGTLDIHNGRYCVTPDYPEGTYAYFSTIDNSGTPVFPYFVGQYSKQTISVTNNGYNGK